MFLIDKASNIIQPLSKKTFSELGFKERAHLQEWIADHPEALGEKLLIIQKEFSGFIDTYERLDLLALDKKGNLVVIENKLDDSGKDVTWQALKYASYVSTLTKPQIREIYQSYLDGQSSQGQAEEKLVEFFESTPYEDLVLNQNKTQRVIMVAAVFRKEVTSTVLWLSSFNIRMQCFKATVYGMEEKNFLTLEQIIPAKDIQDFVISMNNKVQEELSTEEDVKERHKIRLQFWALFLKEIKGKSKLFQNSHATKDHWLVAGGADISGVSFQPVITYTNATVHLNFGRSNGTENNLLFDTLKISKAVIEAKFGKELNWERMDDKKSSRVSFTQPGLNYFNKEEWPQIVGFLIEHINLLETAVRPYLSSLKTALSSIGAPVDETSEIEAEV
jgi:hypothetical protein